MLKQLISLKEITVAAVLSVYALMHDTPSMTDHDLDCQLRHDLRQTPNVEIHFRLINLTLISLFQALR